jgi:hypothetical protein
MLICFCLSEQVRELKEAGFLGALIAGACTGDIDVSYLKYVCVDDMRPINFDFHYVWEFSMCVYAMDVSHFNCVCIICFNLVLMP